MIREHHDRLAVRRDLHRSGDDAFAGELAVAAAAQRLTAEADADPAGIAGDRPWAPGQRLERIVDEPVRPRAAPHCDCYVAARTSWRHVDDDRCARVGTDRQECSCRDRWRSEARPGVQTARAENRSHRDPTTHREVAPEL